LTVDYSFFDAIDERRAFDFFSSYDEQKLQQPIVIMEDDAELEPNFTAALRETETDPPLRIHSPAKPRPREIHFQKESSRGRRVWAVLLRKCVHQEVLGV